MKSVSGDILCHKTSEKDRECENDFSKKFPNSVQKEKKTNFAVVILQKDRQTRIRKEENKLSAHENVRQTAGLVIRYPHE